MRGGREWRWEGVTEGQILGRTRRERRRGQRERQEGDERGGRNKGRSCTYCPPVRSLSHALTVSPGGHLLLMQPRHPRELGIHKYAGPVHRQRKIQLVFAQRHVLALLAHAHRDAVVLHFMLRFKTSCTLHRLSVAGRVTFLS